MSRIPPLLLEQLHAGELDQDTAAALRARIEAQGVQSELEELAASDADILARLPAPAMADAIRGRARPRRLWVAAPVLAAAMGLALFALPVSPETPLPDEPVLEPTNIKGGVRLLVFRQGPEGQQELRDGELARPGDRLQLMSVAGSFPHALVFSVDGSGVLTEHRVGPYQGGTHALPDSYELDDAPEFERFFLVVSAQPIDAEPIFEQAQGLSPQDPLELPSELLWASTTLRKED